MGYLFVVIDLTYTAVTTAPRITVAIKKVNIRHRNTCSCRQMCVYACVCEKNMRQIVILWAELQRRDKSE